VGGGGTRFDSTHEPCAVTLPPGSLVLSTVLIRNCPHGLHGLLLNSCGDEALCLLCRRPPFYLIETVRRSRVIGSEAQESLKANEEEW